MSGALILYGFGFLLIVEGLVLALAPSLLDDILARLAAVPHEQRRIAGVVALALGVLLIVASGV